MISVVIATRNRAALLHETLEAIAAQQSPGCPYEVIVIDNGSSDHTPEAVAAASRRSAMPVVYLHESRPGKSHALNTAVERAQGDLLVLTDDDVLPSPGWLAGYSRAFAETGADYAVGRIVPRWEAAVPSWMSPALYGVLAIPEGGSERLVIDDVNASDIMPIGANMAVRKNVLDVIGGWNPELGKLHGTLRTGEDHEFALRMVAAGFTGVYEPQAVVAHRVPPERLRLGYFQRWFFDNGAIVAGLERRYPTTEHFLFDTPRHMWRELVNDILSLAAAGARLNLPRAVASYLRIVWFAGYFRARRADRGSAAQDGAAVPPRIGESA
ncbi:MAG: glycosyltransferase [Vicinamibacterales bacterium]